MGNPPTLNRSMTDTLSYKAPSGYSSGVLSYGSLQTCDSKQWSIQEVVETGGGKELVTKHCVHTFTEIKKGYLIWFDGEDTSDDNAGHVVDIVNEYPSLAIRGTQWTIYEVKVG